jgi:hypothetical protein
VIDFSPCSFNAGNKAFQPDDVLSAVVLEMEETFGQLSPFLVDISFLKQCHCVCVVFHEDRNSPAPY